MSLPHSRVSRMSGSKVRKNTSSLSLELPLQNSDSRTGDLNCIICAEKVIYSAISPCNNVTCHVCSLRQRALYRKTTCLVCRTAHDDVIFTEQLLEEARFADFVAESRSIYEQEYEIHFTSQYVKDETLKLTLYECPVCQEKFKKFPQLSDHTKTEHGQQYCDICVGQANTFLCELSLFTQKQIQKHINEGNKSGFLGHPRCKFCRGKRFYSEDELNIHIRDRHERCYICNQDNYQVADYYRNYDDLYDHFRSAHFVCMISLCVEKRFVVFREDLDLTAHMLKEHGGIAGQRGRLVIGASSTQVQSQLSTFPTRPQGNLRENNNFNLKKRRLEERVKHYLFNDEAKLAQFQKIDSEFKCKRISALDLVKQFRNLFENSEPQEISLVLYEFIELQPLYSDQRASLQLAFDQMSSNISIGSTTCSFPSLGNSLDRNVLKNLSWGSGIASSRRTFDEQFPALQKRTTAKHNILNNGQFKYTVDKRNSAAGSKPSVSTISFKENTLYKPSYLEHTKSKSSITSLPKLCLSGTSLVASVILSREHSRPQSSSLRTSLTSLSEAKFPALVAKKKREIPPVKPILQASTGWGPGLVRPAPEPKHDWGIPIIDKKAEKLRRKAERSMKVEPKSR